MTHPQQQPECKCKKTGTFVTFTGECPIHHPQQTEQWMEEFDRRFMCTDNGLTKCGELVGANPDVAEDLKSFIKSQIEAAEKRGKDKGRSEERLDLVAAIAIAAHEYLKDLVETDEEGIAEIVGKAVASLTNHN